MMNIKDITNALTFLALKDIVVIVVPSREDIGLVKRSVKHILGEPRKYIGDDMFYDNSKCVRIRSISDNLRGMGTLYYAGYINDANSDIKLMQLGFDIEDRPVEIISLWRLLGLNTPTMLKALLDDGYEEEYAVSCLTLA